MDAYNFQVIEYSNEGFGPLHENFASYNDAVVWVNNAQKVVDNCGNPKDLCWDILPVGKIVYGAFSAEQH